MKSVMILKDGKHVVDEPGIFFNISTYAAGDDSRLLGDIIDQGIDSHLEAFTQSKFGWKGDRLNMDFHVDELQILLRRLLELETEEADRWATDIVEIHYEVECYS